MRNTMPYWMGNSTYKWDIRFLELARLISTWSKDPSTQVGAVIIDANKRIVSAGYNGFPQAIEDRGDSLADRETKYKLIVHGEINALLFCNRLTLSDCCLYTYPIPPCSVCAGQYIQKGIARVVAPTCPPDKQQWLESITVAVNMFKEALVDVSLVINGC